MQKLAIISLFILMLNTWSQVPIVSGKIIIPEIMRKLKNANFLESGI